MIKVFVYGTLKKGFGNHRLLDGRSVFVQEDAIQGHTLFDLGPYPALQSGGEDTISGEVYMIGPNTLRDLDRLEGHPTFYERRVVKTVGGHEVWAYFMDNVRGSARKIEGSWPSKRAA